MVQSKPLTTHAQAMTAKLYIPHSICSWHSCITFALLTLFPSPFALASFSLSAFAFLCFCLFIHFILRQSVLFFSLYQLHYVMYLSPVASFSVNYPLPSPLHPACCFHISVSFLEALLSSCLPLTVTTTHLENTVYYFFIPIVFPSFD